MSAKNETKKGNCFGSERHLNMLVEENEWLQRRRMKLQKGFIKN